VGAVMGAVVPDDDETGEGFEGTTVVGGACG
jgi:hypothetical protein